VGNNGRERGRLSVPAPAGTRAALLLATRVLLYRFTGRSEFVLAGSGDPEWALLDPNAPLAEPPAALVADAAAVRGLGTDELAIALDDSGNLAVDYDPATFDSTFEAGLADRLGRIVAQLDLPGVTARTVDLLDPAERARLVTTFNDTRTDYPRAATVPELFAERVCAAGERTAIVHDGRSWTYTELDVWTDELANRLRALGVRRDQPVAVLFERTPELVAGVLAVLKAGGAYLPVDPRYPAQRLDFMLSDGGVRVVLTTAELAGKVAGLAGFDGDVVLVDRTARPVVTPPLAPVNSATDLAYVMYTSGTTGQPKGVQITHRNVIRLVRGTTYVELSEDTRILQANAIVFDSSTFELWASLLNGGTLVLVGLDTLLDAGLLRRAIVEHDINTLMLTPALFNQLADDDPTLFRPLRHQFVGGDVLSPAHIGAVRAACPDLRIINGYGPTENTCISATHQITDQHPVRIPIGRPLSNSTCYVCDGDGAPQPVGVPGELWVGGDGLARGYHNRPELTERAFVVGDLDPAGRLYRTGDIARWRPDGTLDFLGRADDQVKIRGFRIEPGEIEHQLRRHPDVADAAVVVRLRPGAGEKYLCGYAVCTDFRTARELREHLAEELPDHLIPAYLVVLDEFPLTASGKLDRAALPEPTSVADSDEYRPARDELERKLVAIWERVTGIALIGVTDDIFDLGISSITAAALAAGVETDLGVRLTATALLRHPTIELVAEQVRATGPVEDRLVAMAPERPTYPLSPQQHQLFVEQSKDVTAVHYHQPIVVDLPPEVDVDRLTAVLADLVRRHESLRTGFGHADGAAYQVVHDRPAFTVSHVDSSEVADFVRPFDLAVPPLLRAGVHRGATTRLLLDCHHLISDGVSLRLLFAELETGYRGLDLPPLPDLRYVDYATWTAGPAAARLRADADAYWRGVFDTVPPPVSLPTDFARPATRSLAGATVEFDLDPATTAALRDLAAAEGVTLFQLMLAVYWLFLARVTGADDLTVGVPVAGRTNPGFGQVVGMFVNTVCLRAGLDHRQPFPELLRATRGHVLDAMQHQDFPFDELVSAVGGPRDYARNPLFDTMFALQDAALRPTLLGAEVRLADEALGASMFDLNLHLHEHADQLTGIWGYSTALFTETTVLAFADELEAVARAVLDRPDAPVGELVGRVAEPAPASAGDIEFAF